MALTTTDLAAAPPGAPPDRALPARPRRGGRRSAASSRRVPADVCGHPVECVVVDDGSTDAHRGRRRAPPAPRSCRSTATAASARPSASGSPTASRRGAAAVAFCDADGEYAPEELERARRADPRRRRRLRGRLTVRRPHRADAAPPAPRQPRAHVRAALRSPARPITDGQSGYRALSPGAARRRRDRPRLQLRAGADARPAGARASATPRCRSRTASASTGASFVRLVPYLRAVVPAVWRSCARRRTARSRSVLDDVVRGTPSRAAAQRAASSCRRAQRVGRGPAPSPARGACCRARTGPGARTSAARRWPPTHPSSAANVVLEARRGTRDTRAGRGATSTATGVAARQALRGELARRAVARARRRARSRRRRRPSTAPRRTARCGRAGRCRRRRGSSSAPRRGSTARRRREVVRVELGVPRRGRARGTRASARGSSSAPAASSTASGGAGSRAAASTGSGSVDHDVAARAPSVAGAARCARRAVELDACTSASSRSSAPAAARGVGERLGDLRRSRGAGRRTQPASGSPGAGAARLRSERRRATARPTRRRASSPSSSSGSTPQILRTYGA